MAARPALKHSTAHLGLRDKGGFNQEERWLTPEAGLVEKEREEMQVSEELVQKWREVPPDDLSHYNKVSRKNAGYLGVEKWGKEWKQAALGE